MTATATTPAANGNGRRVARTPAGWEEVAREEILPRLQGGMSMKEVRELYGAGHTIRAALARIGYDTKGRPLEIVPLTGSKPPILAKRVAEARRACEPWWLVELRTGKTEAQLKELLTKCDEEGYADVLAGRVTKAA